VTVSLGKRKESGSGELAEGLIGEEEKAEDGKEELEYIEFYKNKILKVENIK
jgi:hypothetical protein